MLKTEVGDEVWLVHQPDHARLAGYLAAHWGNADGFARPGYFAPAPDPDRIRQEVVHAIAEHDNGWWEWEADPSIDPADGLPRDLPDVAKEQEDAGLQRWRKGVPRLADEHPYIGLLISLHAYWLYAFAFEDIPDRDDALKHPIFGRVGTVNRLVANPALTRVFLTEQEQIQRSLVERLSPTPLWKVACEPAHLLPHARLLQTLDALSLLISFGARTEHTLHDIPRRAWNDRVSLSWQPGGNRRIVCRPFPFDVDPLTVYLPARVLRIPSHSAAVPNRPSPLVNLHATPLSSIQFEIASS